MSVPTLSLHIQRGEYWQRVIAPRDKRTHWPAPSSAATAFMADSGGASVGIPASIQWDFSILLLMDETATAALVDGTYYFEVWANPYLPYYNLGALVPPSSTRFQRIAVGTIEVSTLDSSDFLTITTVDDLAPNTIIGGAPA